MNKNFGELGFYFLVSLIIGIEESFFFFFFVAFIVSDWLLRILGKEIVLAQG